MNRFEYMKDIFFKMVEDQCFGIMKQKSYFHSIQVMTICQQLSLKKHLNLELVSIMALFHDYSQYVYHSSFQHALKSAQATKDIMLQSNLFSDEEINCVYQAILHHSDKDKIHDDYSELLKDGDIIAQYLAEPDCVLPHHSQQRLNKYLTFYMK